MKKRSSRIRNHGEVFTPDWMAEKMYSMLDKEDELIEIKKKYLEPSVGEGIFLSTILKNKLSIIDKNFAESIEEYEVFSLFALTTLYGIELLEDNVQMCCINLYEVYKDFYRKQSESKNKNMKKSVLQSAKVIIKANIEQGNFITGRNSFNEPIIFSDWINITNLKPRIKKLKIHRTEYTINEIYNKNKNENGLVYKNEKMFEQLSIFELKNNESSVSYFYTEIDIRKIHLEEVKKIEKYD